MAVVSLRTSGCSNKSSGQRSMHACSAELLLSARLCKYVSA